MPIEFHRDGPWTVPEGWVWARAGDVLPIEYGKGLLSGFVTAQDQYRFTGRPALSARTLQA